MHTVTAIQKIAIRCMIAVNGEKFSSYYCFVKSFYGLLPSKQIEQRLEHKHPDTIIDVTMGSKDVPKTN